MTPDISSTKNPKIKNLIALQKPRERKEQQAFVIEGIREISLAQQSGFEITDLFVCSKLYSPDSAYPISQKGLSVYDLSEEVFSKTAYREGAGGVIAVAKTKPLTLQSLPKAENPIFLVLENVEKPGNIGAMLRTADAAGLSGVIVCDPATDFYNPNVVRSSVGCLFTVPVAATTPEEALIFFKQRGISTYAAALTKNSGPYHQFDYTQPTAFLLGAESTGLSEFWLRNADSQVIIPMRGKIDSMNVSNAAAVLIFEAMRQREFKN